MSEDWPVDLDGVTESVVATRGPEGAWNFAALGLHAGDPVTARTWGRTRTRRNFEREGSGIVQFVHDPVVFTECALSVLERIPRASRSRGVGARGGRTRRDG